MSLIAVHAACSGQPFASILRLSDPFCRSGCRPLLTSPRAALVRERPSALPAPRDGGKSSLPTQLVLAVDRTDDLQAEVRAMARAADAPVYSPEVLAAKYGSRPVKGLRRTLRIFIAMVSFGVKLWVDQRNGVLDRNKRRRAAELRGVLTRLGPTFVKLGQALSTRPDICPQEYLDELPELQSV